MTSACRIETLSTDGAKNNLPFVLTASCGWATTVEQGIEWERHPARTRWVEHDCALRETG